MTTHGERQVDRPASKPSSSYWWYILVLTPMVASLVALVGVAVIIVVALNVTVDLSTYVPAYFALAFMGLPLAVAYPLALYRDAAAVADLDGPWIPNPRRYAIAGVVSVLTLFLFSMLLSWYYLCKRRRYIGVP